MAGVAKKIELLIHPDGSATLFIDGAEFPWHVNSDGLELGSKVGELPTLTVSILAEKVVTRFAIETRIEEPESSSEQSVASFGEIGDKFILSHVGELPSHVLSIKCLGDESHNPYLLRSPNHPDLWGWGSSPTTLADGAKAEPLEHWAKNNSPWGSEQFKIVRVAAR